MADTKKLNLQVTVDKKALEVLKVASKNTIEEIKALSRQTVEQVKQDGRLKVETEKTTQARIKAENEKRINDDNLNYKRDKDNFIRAEKEKVRANKETNEKIKQDDDLVRRSKQRMYEGMFGKKPVQAPSKLDDSNIYKGQFTSLNSVDALNQQIRYYTGLRNSVDTNSKAFNEYTEKVLRLKKAKQDLGSTTLASKYQIAEFGENLTTLAAGAVAATYALYQGAQAVIQFGIHALRSAAELEVYYEKFVELEGGVDKARKQLQLLRQASSGNLSDIDLVKYSNGMRLVGKTSEQTAQFLDFVERQADSAGITFEEGFSAIEKFTTTGATKGLVGIKINLVDVQREMRALTGFTNEQIDKMADEDKQLLRTNAIISLYGRSIDEINSKQKDSGDKIQSLSTAYQNFTTFLGGTLLPIFNTVYTVYDKLDKGTKTLTGNTLDLKKALTGINYITYGIVGGFVTVGGAIVNVANSMKNFLSQFEAFEYYFANSEVFGFFFGNDKKTEQKKMGFGDIKSSDNDYRIAEQSNTANSYNDKRKQADDWKKLAEATNDADKELKKYYTDKFNYWDKEARKSEIKSNTGGNNKKEENLFTLQEYLNALNAEIELEELLNKYHIKTNEELSKAYKTKLDDLNANKDLIQVVNQKLSAHEKEVTILKNQAEFLKKQAELEEKINAALQARLRLRPAPAPEGGYENPNRGGNAENNRTPQPSQSAPAETSKPVDILGNLSVVNNELSSMWSIFSDRQDTFIAKFLKTWGDTLSIVKSIQLIFEAIKAINEGITIAKAIIPFLADGGPATAGMPHIVGERGPELFIPNVNGTVISHANTNKLLADAVRANTISKAYQNMSSMSVGVKLHENIKDFIVTTVKEEKSYRVGAKRV